MTQRLVKGASGHRGIPLRNAGNGSIIFTGEYTLSMISLFFTDLDLNPATFLVTGQPYLLTYENDGESYNLSTIGMNPSKGFSSILQSTSSHAGKVIVFIPTGKSILASDNISNFLYTLGDTFDQMEQVYIRATDFYYLTGQKEIRDCTPHKSSRCSGGNGCGLPSGCPVDMVCQNGDCIDLFSGVPDQVCLQDGSQLCRGKCFGKCQFGYLCETTIDGSYRCAQTSIYRRQRSSWVTVVMVFIGFAIAVIVFAVLRTRYYQKVYYTEAPASTSSTSYESTTQELTSNPLYGSQPHTLDQTIPLSAIPAQTQPSHASRLTNTRQFQSNE